MADSPPHPWIALAEASQRHLDELIQWLKIPSVSSDSQPAKTTSNRAARWLADKFRDAGTVGGD